MNGAAPRRRPTAAPRRRPAAAGSPWRAVAVASAVALGAVGAVAAPRAGVPLFVGAAAAAAAAFLAVLALPSFPTRAATVLLLGVAGLGALRHAALPSTDSNLIILWAAGTVTALIFIDRAAAEDAQPLAGGTRLAGRVPEAARAAAMIGAVVAIFSVVLVPTVTDQLGRHIWPGVLPTFADAQNAPASLRASGRLDMTNRPRLSERVVFTVDAPRADFWRGEIFDVWDGSAWTRSDRDVFALPRHGDTVRTIVDPNDPGATNGEPMTQTFTLESDFADVLFAAPAAVEFQTRKMIVGRPDGTAAVVGGLGRDAVYTVTSRSSLPTEETLRAADANTVRDEISDQYAQAPVATERVRQLAVRITAGASTSYDKIRAIERWLGIHTRYSLDAPLSPSGADVVDHFLFESREGWCEQVASSLVVLARSVGIPARLATGFVPGDRDPLSGRFIVRERDAHAWTEVFFPGVGWQGFDPTASVPLAGDAGSSGSWFETARDHMVELIVVLGLVCWAVVAAPGLLAGIRRRLAARRSWGARTLARRERVGARAGRPREPAETPREYSGVLATLLNRPELAVVGDVIDRDAFSSGPADAQARAAADAALKSVPARQ
ncbi:MAG: transglutaminaseTgpA domain-containing protein [Acidimicrobiia bacterium]